MTFEHRIEINGDIAWLFALTQNYSRRTQWDPFLQSAELMDGAKEAGIGVKAWCVGQSGMGMETEYVSYSPPRVAAVKMTRGPWLLERFAGSWRFEEVKSNCTRVQFTYNLHARPRWLSWLLTPVVGWLFSMDMRRRLASLKKVVETQINLQGLPLS